MSALDIVDDVFYIIKRYIFPTLFLTVGVFALLAALSPQEIMLNNGKPLVVEQSPLFLYGSLLLVLGSLIWFLYLFGIINSMVGYIVMAVLLIGSGVVLYYDWAVVQADVEFRNMYAEREVEIQTRIMDVKTAEVAYKEVNGTYTNNMDSLVDFVKNGTKMDFIKNGSLPDRKITTEERDMIYGDNRPIDKLMNEMEATYIARKNGGMIDGNKFQRDTVFVSVMQAIFDTERYKESRSKLGGEIPFHPDSLRHVPFSDELTQLDTASVMKGEIRVPTLQISMTHPMEDPILGHVVYTVGSISDNHLRDNWSK